MPRGTKGDALRRYRRIGPVTGISRKKRRHINECRCGCQLAGATMDT